jgi:hypothetical protein
MASLLATLLRIQLLTWTTEVATGLNQQKMSSAIVRAIRVNRVAKALASKPDSADDEIALSQKAARTNTKVLFSYIAALMLRDNSIFFPYLASAAQPALNPNLRRYTASG